MTLYILSYNNYYNRIVKKEDTVEAYLDHVVYGPLPGVSGFTPGDGVNTTHVFGSNSQMYSGNGDYMLALNPDGSINSRWFIIDANRERNGQWTVTLHRDLVVDFYDQVIDKPMFIEKATLQAGDPLIFNKENIQVNQIKQKEFLLENRLKTPWVVAYLSRGNLVEEEGQDPVFEYSRFNGTFKFEEETSGEPDYSYSSESEFNSYYPYSYWTDHDYYLTDNISFHCYYRYPTSNPRYMYMSLKNPGSFTGNFAGAYWPGADNWPTRESAAPVCPDPVGTYKSLLQTYKTYNSTKNGLAWNSISGVGTQEGFNVLARESGKIVKIGSTYHRIIVETDTAGYDTSTYEFLLTQGTDMYNAVFDKLVKPSGLTYNDSTTLRASVNLPFTMTRISISLKKIEDRDMKYNFTYTSAVTSDAAYEIIATPLKDTAFSVAGGGVIVSSGNVGLQWFQALKTNHPNAVYDVQIVPYCPIDTSFVENYSYVTTYQGDEPTNIVALGFKLPLSSFRDYFDVSLPLSDNVKIGSETELWRLTSPNGVGNFDFNPYKNNGWKGFEVDITLLPIDPYIKINPMFDAEGLYGGDFNDYRGLICSGDFSVSLISSEWMSFKEQNKNYLSIFNREIETLEKQNSVGLGQDIASAVTGTLTGAASGALTGASIGGGYGAIGGAVVGGVLSAGAGIADIFVNESLRNEAIDYKKDQFGYNLQTIQAKPNTLARTTSYNINNKYFPYIEFYTCKEREKQALANKIAWNGMTVMAIGTMNDYIGNSWSYNGIQSEGYIKGKLIRLDNTNEDFHIVNSISGELDKGVYIK